MNSDPIVEEIHRIRAEMLARFNGDLHALVEDARRRQAASGRSSVTFKKDTVPPRADVQDGSAGRSE
jgi:hypothetical protein